MFCRKCGSKITDDSVFCQKCGERVSGDGCEMRESVEYDLTVDRRSEVYLVNPPMKVVIDGIIRFSVENGQTESRRLSPGKHEVEFSSSVRRAKVNVDLKKDTVIEIGWNRLTGAITTTVI